MTRDDKMFRVGFIRGMKKMADGIALASLVRNVRWPEYANGVTAAYDHWNGHVTPDVNRAADLGLVDLYEGFHGQSDWTHPDS